ncbi:hypothetical protein [Acidaminobacter sp.]|uniref:hypothetical protein n=1 Tax=Acidaminobacter sp. TaxID=1872102 RepID=UPI002560635E|nr:hypothetical protein [Acidaminobacter sp.]MDK9712474.1 hypothetical protein [Acidaminobacter sp.]
MLTDIEYESIKNMATNCNCTYSVAPRKRKGATGMAQSLFLHQADTKELVISDMEIIARDNPGNHFHIKFDGIARFTVTVNDKVMLESDYYEVEDCYQISGTEFQQRLLRGFQKL